MSLGYLKLASVGAMGVGGTAGTVYLGSKIADFSGVEGEQDDIVDVIADKFKDRLLKDTQNNKAKWDARFQRLKADNSNNLHASLQKIKGDTNAKVDDLKTWCTDAYIKPIEDETFTKNVEQFCTLFIQDQISNLLKGKTEDKWSENNDVLEKKEKRSLSKEMQEIQDKLKTDKKALSTWCLGKYESFYKGKDDPTYKDVHEFCRKIAKKPAKTSEATGPTSTVASPEQTASGTGP
ncbi:hypothetical protein MHC_02880 [Mycoplasma haemocanis str. Illinois]|uniref:Uncharacterized protein n=1 Tax=Mycoplasma haemocanis (strain Illinois) TaxID=1111676 RepID=H6N716_MYCHN|nr:hypothetical protein [Mycoplasma haemocanis]AEW45438.1 hypothetical protein MHC_02880 [Mycoplasma haemocanis str. Illinois]